MAAPTSLRRNYLYGGLFTLLNVAHPLIFFSYLSRKVGPEALGRLNIAVALASFFALAATLSMPLYGSREIARSREDRDALETRYSQLFLVVLAAGIACTAVYGSLFLVSARMREDWILYALAGSAILSSALTVDWLFQGVEDNRSILRRSLLIKIVSLALLFAFVRSPGHIQRAAAINGLSLAAYAGLGLLAARRHARLRLRGTAGIAGHLRSMAILSASTWAAAAYAYLDSVLLGFLGGDKAVGLFSAGTRAVKTAVNLVHSLGATLIPRLTWYRKHDREDEFRAKADKSLSATLMIASPMAGACLALAPEVVQILAGTPFAAAVPAMRISAILVVIMAYNSFLGLQVLFPRGGEAKLLAAALLAGATNAALNLLLIPRFGHNGTAMALVATEACSLAAMAALGRKECREIRLFRGGRMRYVAAGALAAGVMHLLAARIAGSVPALLVAGAAGMAAYAAVLLLLRDPLALELASLARRRLRLP